MNRIHPPGSESFLFVEALEPRIAPAGLLNEAKFTSITAGGSVLLDATDPNGFQGITTGFGPNSGSYLLYITAGKALVYTSDLNGNGKVDANEITGIAAGVDSQGRGLDLISFVNINGDIATNLMPGIGNSNLTDSDNNAANGRDGRILLDNGIHSITLRTLTPNDLDLTVPGNTVANRLALTSFSIFGNIYTGGDFGAPGAGLTIDTSGAGVLSNNFSGFSGSELYTGSTPVIGSIKTGTATNYQHFHFGESSTVDIQGTFLPFKPKSGEHGADIYGVHAADAATVFDVGAFEAGNGGVGARGGNISDLVLHGDRGGYKVIAGDGGQGGSGAVGGSVLNFNDLGTVNSSVVVHSGSGGVGLLGAGGAGGTVTFVNAQIASDLTVVLGDGGNGFTAGGNGSSQTTGSFLPPEGTVPVGGLTLGTYHEIGDIGNTKYVGTDAAGNANYVARAIDFDGDGFGDVVYTTKTPDQIVILFGDGNGGFNPAKTIYLDAPGVSLSSLVVADFNGDGKPDIAAASADLNNFGGIHLFLNQIGSAQVNPTGGKNYLGNPLGNHPFSDPLQSPLPTFSDLGFFQGRSAIVALTAGDYNGDGIMDIGVAANYTTTDGVNLIVDRFIMVSFGDDVRNPNTGERLLDPVTGKPEGAGYFVPNLAAPGQVPLLQFADYAVASTNRAILRTSNLAVGSGQPDTLFYAQKGSTKLSEFNVFPNPTTHVPFSAFLFQEDFSLGKVDTNRSGDVSLAGVSLQDYTLQDLNGDGNMDSVVLSTSPVGFLVTFMGLGYDLNPAIASLDSVNNAGIKIGVGDTEPIAIQPIDLKPDGTQNGIFNQVAILELAGDTKSAVIQEFSLQDLMTGAPDFYAGGTGVAGARTFASFFIGGDDTVTGFDAFYPQVATGAAPTLNGYAEVNPNSADYRFAEFEYFSSSLTEPHGFQYLTNNGVHLIGGNGGNSTAGVAGNGGTIGTSLGSGVGGVPVGSIEFVFPAYFAYQGNVSFSGGQGGNGFLGGGLGGDVTGVSSRIGQATAAGVVSLFAGSGGNGIGGDGGRGGDLSAFSTDLGALFVAGNGGTGLHGGRGGSILGNQTGTFFDVQNDSVTAIAGFGGAGALAGGAGGAISNLNVIYEDVLLGGSDLLYVSGNGGGAAAGIGGNGGGIINSSPNPTANSLSLTLTLGTGKGGNGLQGGTGGEITNFVNQPTNSQAIPSQLNVITGAGGIGVSGPGGAGGTITNFRSNSLGLDPFTGLADLVRVVAGQGGASYSGVGGNGGSVVGSTAQAVSSPIAIIAGAGGAGLTQGGDGGTVRDSTFNSASQTLGKVLIVAGAGGDASAALPSDVFIPGDGDTSDLAHAILAFGGISGIGGNGGNITNITQPISVQTSVDLIAGNGGSTLNTGNSVTATSNVGVGGSVVNVNLAGNVGNPTTVRTATNVNQPIRSYTDTNGDGKDDETMQQFVDTQLTGTVDGAGFTPVIGYDRDTFFAPGNVGIVAGVSGRVAGNQPPRNGINGSVQNIAASSIMSIVAGSVNNIAPVTTVSGLTLKSPDGVLGADKSLPGSPTAGGPNNQLDYYDQNGNLVHNAVQPGYRLIDGAIYALQIIPSATPPQLAGPRVFPFL